MKKLMLIFIVVIIQLHCQCYALSVETHEDMNEYIARNNMNGFSLSSYLKNNLGIVSGITTSFDSREVWQLLRDGGRYEDRPPWSIFLYFRSANYFHDPLKDLAHAGFSGIWNIPHLLRGDSAVLWSQKVKNAQSPGWYYSWHDVRNYFYNALTATNKDARSTNFASMFRGLGQLMHLVQDMSVPEHSRNSGHYAEERGQTI